MQEMTLRSIELTSGDSITVSPGVTAIVGPNNAGKSSILRDLFTRLTIDSAQIAAYHTVSIAGATVKFAGTVDDLRAQISSEYELRPEGQYPEGLFQYPSYRFSNGAVVLDLALDAIHAQSEGFGAFGSYFALYLNAESRLGLTGDTGSFDVATQAPNGPVQEMYSDRGMEKLISGLTRRAFQTGLVLNRYSGGVLRLHVGDMVTNERRNPQSVEYIRELFALPALSSQGDGVKAFVGMCLSIVSGRFPLVIIDEPEAFLHPPQARIFGEFLAEQATAGTQVLIATHSEDIVAGLTSRLSDVSEISIVRITRDKAGNRASQLDANTVRELYADPLIRYYDMLNGLFTPAVILCEADGDCTYYRAVLDTLGSKKASVAFQSHITHAGGKSRIARAIHTFRTASVPVAAIFDIDILQLEGEFNAVVSAVGFDPATFASRRADVISMVSAATRQPSRVSLRAEIEDILAKSKSSTVSTTDLAKIKDRATTASGWRRFKHDGESMLSAQALLSFNSLCSELASQGVFLLRQGELERLHPDLPQSDKATWLRQVMSRGVYRRSPALPMLLAIDSYLRQ